MLRSDYNMKPWDIIKLLEVTPGRLDKEDIVRTAIGTCPEFFAGARLAYDPMITFGVKKVPVASDIGSRTYLTGNKFEVLVEALADRVLTGHAARDAIQNLCDAAATDEWNYWYRRILLKDLKCGVTDTIISKIARKAKRDELAIPIFECQLAKSAVDADGNLQEDLLVGKRIIDVKMDGTRCLAVCLPSGKVTLYSRNGKEWLNFGHISLQLSQYFTPTINVPWVLDGEVMSASFQDLMRQARRKSNVKAADAILNIFDAVPLSAFLKGHDPRAQVLRRAELATMIQDSDNMPHVHILGWDFIDFGTPVGQKAFADINRRALEGGYEGIMVKDPEAPYRCKRSNDWLKIKPFIEVTLKCTGIELGRPGSKYAGAMGAAVCEGTDEGKAIKVNVGGGWSDKQRKELKDNPKLITGHMIEVRGDALTKSQNGDTWSIRFPRFKCFRGTKRGEKQ